MKKILVLFICLTVSFFAFGAHFHSVPLDNEAYRIIDNAEARGLIPPQNEVKPYNLNKVVSLLEAIASRDIGESDKKSIVRVLGELEQDYGYQKTESFSDVLSNGSISFGGSNPMKMGGIVSTVQTVGMKQDDGKVFDSRNSGTAYIMGDIGNFLSYDLNFRVNLDRIDTNAFLPTELKFTTEGFYLDPLNGGDRLVSLPDGNFYLGIETFPELSADIMDVVSLRIGAVNRDWGPGKGNIALSGSARVMDGFEFTLTPNKWFSYSAMTASLGLASLETVNGVDWPSENMDKKNGEYFNNLNIHRVEVGPFAGIKFSIWESVVWRKRFELSYLNPLAIYMFSQNSLGDYDNMLAGFDVTYTLPGVGSFYGAISFDELNSIKNPFTCPRNMLAYQIGGKFSIPAASFSLLQLQATYIPAFYGAHYPSKRDLFGGVAYMVNYVNKGQNISYPVNPDTLELLASFETTVTDGWNISLLVKDQMRSAQYATKSTGTDILTYMEYDGYDYNDLGEWGYYPRDFFNNIWNNIVDVEVSAKHKFDSIPLTLTVGVQGILETSRSFEPMVVPAYSDGDKKSWPAYHPGKILSWGDWESTFTINTKIGVSVFY